MSRKRNTPQRWYYKTLVLLAAFGLLTGCGIGQGSAVKIDDGDPIKIGVIPVADFAPVYIAIEEGIFEAQGLNVEAQVMQNAAAIAPAVVNGQLQFGTSAQTPFITAVQKTLPLLAVANSANTALSPQDDASALMVAENSDIKSPKDLEGKVVSVNALNSIIHVAAKAAVVADGGNPDLVDFVAMPLPDMAHAVASGQVDAASVVEPFVVTGQAAGNRSIAEPYTTAFTPGETYALVFTARPFVETNPEVVRKFVHALNQASELASQDPDTVREVLVEYGGLDPKLAESMQLPQYGTEISTSALDEASQTMMDLGFLEGTVSGKDLVWK